LYTFRVINAWGQSRTLIYRCPTVSFFLQREHLTASANYLVPVIFGAGLLKQWAITHSLKDCCLWANLLIISAIPPPLPLSNYLGALTSNLGCFSLDTEAYQSVSHWLTIRLSIQSLRCIGTALAGRARIVALQLRSNINRCASTHIGEIQLAPDSIGISPLTTAHPLFFQQQSVSTST